MTAEERFAKRFGRLQREIGEAVVSFYQEVGELPTPVPNDQTAFWMDDQRALMVLSICGQDAAVDRYHLPTSWWQHFKASLHCSWIHFKARVIVVPVMMNGNVRTEADVEEWTRYLEEHP